MSSYFLVFYIKMEKIINPGVKKSEYEKESNKMDGKLLAGLILVFLGLLFLIQNFFGLAIPIGEIFWPSLLIIIGFLIVFRPKRHYSQKTYSGKVIFDDQKVEATDEEREYGAIFGRLDVDLTKVQVKKSTLNIKIEAIFSSGNIIINEKMPIKIEGSAAFGGVTFPDGTTATFGDRIYTTESYKASMPHLNIKTSAVFSGLKIIKK